MIARRALLAGALGGLSSLAGPAWAKASRVRIAVASNFAEPAQALARRFEAGTGHRPILSLGASGQLFAQITQGAPFDVFLSADVARARRAETSGLAVAGSRFTYATGRLALWSRTPGLVDARGEVLARGDFRKLAIADPKTAPYGTAAMETLRSLGLLARLTPRLVTGASIAQAYKFAATGAAELGFVALSQVSGPNRGSRWIVPPHFHSPIAQQAVLLKSGATRPAARAFIAFLQGPEAAAIIRRYGYEAS